MEHRSLRQNQWAENNVHYDEDDLELDYKWNYITCYTAIGILVHSFIIHGRKYDSVRACTDFACVLAIIPAISTAVVRRHPSLLTTVIVNQVVNFVICGSLIKVCDLYMFYSRYCVIQRVPPVRRKIHYTIWIAIYGALSSTVIVTPFFVNLKSVYFKPIYRSIYGFVLVAFVLYALYFTVMSIRLIWSLTSWERHHRFHNSTGLLNFTGESTASYGPSSDGSVKSARRSPLWLWSSLFPASMQVGGFANVLLNDDNMLKNLPEGSDHAQHGLFHMANLFSNNNTASVNTNTTGGNTAGAAIRRQKEDTGIQSAVWRWRLKVVAYKSVIHALISVAGMLGTLAVGNTVSCTVGFQTILTMHFVFNYRIEDVIWPSKSVGAPSRGRETRELSAIWQLRKGVGLVKRLESATRPRKVVPAKTDRLNGGGYGKRGRTAGAACGGVIATDSQNVRVFDAEAAKVSTQGGEGGVGQKEIIIHSTLGHHNHHYHQHIQRMAYNNRVKKCVPAHREEEKEVEVDDSQSGVVVRDDANSLICVVSLGTDGGGRDNKKSKQVFPSTLT
jgi:hypothetical protein